MIITYVPVCTVHRDWMYNYLRANCATYIYQFTLLMLCCFTSACTRSIRPNFQLFNTVLYMFRSFIQFHQMNYWRAYGKTRITIFWFLFHIDWKLVAFYDRLLQSYPTWLYSLSLSLSLLLYVFLCTNTYTFWHFPRDNCYLSSLSFVRFDETGPIPTSSSTTINVKAKLFTKIKKLFKLSIDGENWSWNWNVTPTSHFCFDWGFITLMMKFWFSSSLPRFKSFEEWKKSAKYLWFLTWSHVHLVGREGTSKEA